MGVSKKEIKKKMLIKQTINNMNKQIQKLEAQKQVYIDAGKQAKQKGLTAQYNLALAGLKTTITVLYLMLGMVAVDFHVVAVFDEIAFSEDGAYDSKPSAWDNTLIC